MREDIVVIEVRVVLAWLLLTGVFLGFGNMARRVFWRSAPYDLMDLWWGWAGAIVVLQLWHFALPVDWRAGLVIAIVGLVGLGIGILRRDHHRLPARTIWYLAVGIVIAFWLSLHSTNQPGNCDSGLYHLNSVRWAKEYPIVPGLGNLHARLAFNQSYFLYVALLDVGPFAHKSHQLASGLLVLWTLLKSTSAVQVALRRERRLQGWVIYDLVMIVPILHYVVSSGNISSPSPDIAIFLMGNAMASELIRVLAIGRIPDQWRQDSGVWLLILLACVGVTVKLSFAAVAAATCGVLLVHAWRTAGRSQAFRLVAGMLAVGAAVELPWMVRGCILSGYPLYPVAIGRLAVDWCVPRANINRSYSLIRMWAATWGDSIPSACVGTARGYWLWLMAMLRTEKTTLVVPLAMAICSMVCGACLRRRRNGIREPGFGLLFFIVPCVGVPYWFFTAPDPRFGGAIFWMLGGGAMAFALVQVPRRYAAICLVLVSCLLFFHEIEIVDFIKPWEKDSGPVKTVAVVEKTTDSGLKVFVAPEKEAGRTWDSELPSAPFFSPYVSLRVPGDMARGFRTVEQPRPAAGW